METTMKEEWHLEKSVSLSHILTTVMFIVAAISAFYSLSARISIVEDKIVSVLENSVRMDKDQEDDLAQFRTEMRADTVEINNKLDMVLDSLIN